MQLFVNDRIVSIDTNKRPYKSGSEGKLYLKDDKLYKIYYKDRLHENLYHKYVYHKYLSNLNTNQIDLPSELISDKKRNYLGYTTKLITKKNTGFKDTTLLDSKIFLQNLKNILEEIDYLTDNNVALKDVSPINFILNDDIMHIIDPGRYIVSDIKDKKNNLIQIKELMNKVICLDLKYYQKMNKETVLKLNRVLDDEIPYSCLYDYYSIELEDYPNLLEYSKERIRYIK